MPKCIKCGNEISEEQYNEYNKMCPDCTRLFKYDKKHSGKCLLCIGFLILINGLGLFAITFGYYISGEGDILSPLLFIIVIVVALLLIYYGLKKVRS